MNHDLFPSLDFRCLQNWAKRLVESCFTGAGIDQITLREYSLWNNETSELAKAIRLRSKSHPEFLVIIHLSEKYEHNNRRTELIRAVHGPTIWDEQNYLALGINTSFLDCLKRPTISNLCEEMQRFVFWCYGAQQGEYSPETNGYDWPLHADPKGDFGLLYPEASSDRKPQSPLPDRFSPSSSETIQEQVDMKFISEIRDIDDEAFVSLQNLKVLRANIDLLMLMYKNCTLFGYRFIFIGIEVVKPTHISFSNSNSIKDVNTVPAYEKITFIRERIRESKEKFYDEACEYWISLERIELLKSSETIGWYGFILNRYNLEEYKYRLENGDDVFAIPAKLHNYDDIHDHEVYFKKSDIVEFLLEPQQPVFDPALPEWLKPDVKTEMSSEAFVKSLREDVLKIYRIIYKLSGKAAIDAATSFLKNNPCPYIKPEYLTEDMFPNVNKPDRAFKANMVKVAMLNKGYKPMEQTEIIKILTE